MLCWTTNVSFQGRWFYKLSKYKCYSLFGFSSYISYIAGSARHALADYDVSIPNVLHHRSQSLYAWVSDSIVVYGYEQCSRKFQSAKLWWQMLLLSDCFRTFLMSHFNIERHFNCHGMQWFIIQALLSLAYEERRTFS